MVFNLLSSNKNEDICYLCNRFYPNEFPKYYNPYYEFKHLKEIVTMDCALCEILEKELKEYDLNKINYNKINDNQQYLYISFCYNVPFFVNQNFTFAGYDIVENYTSILTNRAFDNNNIKINISEITNLGLINTLEKAKKIKSLMTKHFGLTSEETKIVMIYRKLNK